MKTLELKAFQKTLSELNNSFTHYSFVWNQFSLDYADILEKSPETLTQDYFQGNSYKRKHNIKFGELSNEHSNTHETLIKGIFLLIYTQYESYLKDLLAFARNVDSSIDPLESKMEDVENDFMLIDKVFNRISIDKNNLPEELQNTLDYIRLKRNRLIHSNAESISNSLNSIIIKQGKKLNDYWNTKLPGNLQGIDFSDKDCANDLNFNIVIDIINIFRSITNQVDQLIIDKLKIDRITEKIIIPKFKEIQGKRINGIKSDRIVSKFTKFCLSEFSLTINNDQINLLKCSIV